MIENIPPPRIQPIPIQYRMTKTYVVATTRKGHHTQKANNASVELWYFKILKLVKQSMAKTHQTVFERDQRNDNSHNAFTIHSYLSQSILLELSCDITCNFYVEYAFNPLASYPVEDKGEIIKLLRTYPLDTKAKEKTLKDFNEFYQTVLQVQDPRFLFSY